MSRSIARNERNHSRWQDASPFVALRHDVDNLFDQFFGKRLGEAVSGTTAPRVDMSETSESIEVKTDLPGVKPEEVEIELNDNCLTIRGEQSSERDVVEDDDRKFHRVERSAGAFSTSVWLPAGVSDDGVEAVLTDGVLTVTLPKSASDKAVRVPVKG